MKEIKLLFLSLLCILGLVSCSPKMIVNIDEKNNLSLGFESGTGENIRKNLYSLTGVEEGRDIFSVDLVKNNLGLIGFKDNKVIVKDNVNLIIATGKKPVKDISDKLAEAVSFSGGAKPRLKVTLSPEIVQNIVYSFPEETTGYIDLLMAPVFNNDEMSKSEYLDLLGVVYGDTLAQKTGKAYFNMKINTPDKVKDFKHPEIKGMIVKKDNKALIIQIPLVEFLCLNKEISFEVSW